MNTCPLAASLNSGFQHSCGNDYTHAGGGDAGSMSVLYVENLGRAAEAINNINGTLSRLCTLLENRGVPIKVEIKLT